MPTIPTMDNQVGLRQAPSVQRQPLRSTVGQDVGAGLLAVGQVAQNIQREERLKADRAAFMDADRQTDEFSNGLISQAQSKQLKDAIGITPQLLEDFDKRTAEVSNGLKSDRQKMAYRESVNSRRSQLQRQLDSHERGQTEAYYESSRNSYKDQAHKNAVTSYTDPKAIEGEIAKIATTIDQTPGLDGDQRAAELGVRRSGVYAGVIDRYLANDDVAGADAYYKSVRDKINGDIAARIENNLTDARARIAAATRKAGITAQANRVLSAYAGFGPEGGADAMAELAKSGLPPDQLSDIYAEVQQGVNRLRNQKQEEFADTLNTLNRRIASDTANIGDLQTVENLWRQNALSPTERASLSGRVEAAFKQGAVDQATALEVRNALATGIPLDPQNDKQRKALDAAFKADAGDAPVGSAPWQALAAAYATRTRMLPNQATSWVRSAIRSPDPAVAGPAVQFLGAVEAGSPDAASGFDKDTKAFAGMASSMIDAGTPPAQAIETARETVFNIKPPIIELRKKLYSTKQDGAEALVKSNPGALNTYIDRDFDTAFSRQPVPTASLQADFDSQAQNYYLKTGDIDLARELAWRDLKRVYGPSEVNGGKQVMALPPERFGVKPEDIRADIGAFLTDNPQPDGSTADEVIVVPDSLTLRDVNSVMDGQPVSPTYKLITKTGDLVTDKNGVPLRYALPAGDELAAKIAEAQAKAAADAQKQVDDARAEREARRERERQTLEQARKGTLPRRGGLD